MPAKKIRTAPAAALLSDTALSATPHLAQTPTDGEGQELFDGLTRTLARRREAPVPPATAKATTLAKLAKAAKAGQPKPVRSVRNIGPRSGHK
jgi:hypothetical protein